MIKPTRTSQTDWDTHAGHPLQSWAWGEFRKAMGIDVIRFNDRQLTFHKIPYTPWTIGYFPKGPIPTQEMIGELLKIGAKRSMLFLSNSNRMFFPTSNFQYLTSYENLTIPYSQNTPLSLI